MNKLLLRNKLHLNQAWNTPCAKGSLRNYIGDCGLGLGCHDILKVNFDPNNSKNLPVDYKSLMKIQNESTSFSPSGRHYGHYKAILDHNNLCLVHT
eukprot:11812620-Ditylum_brightwellii.AAC.1